MSTKLDLKYNNTLITSLTPENNETTLLTNGKYCANDINAEMSVDWYEGEVISSISVTTPPIKTNYVVGETLDITGLVVQDNNGNNITNDCTFNPAVGATLQSSDTSVIISYSGLTCNYAITCTLDYLCFTANTTGSTITFGTIDSEFARTPVLQTSMDSTNWNDYTIATTITLSNIGDKVYFRGANDTFMGDGATCFIMTGSIAASGNVNFLLDPTGALVTFTEDNGNCFTNLFKNCSALTSCPRLPATTLAEDCYSKMFEGCTGLVIPPLLSATTLASRCYQQMFEGCTGLTTLPALPATTLPDFCYYDMFRGCTGVGLSETQTGSYTNEYRIPTTGTGTEGYWSTFIMFENAGGSVESPTINTTYYTQNQPVG